MCSIFPARASVSKEEVNFVHGVKVTDHLLIVPLLISAARAVAGQASVGYLVISRNGVH